MSCLYSQGKFKNFFRKDCGFYSHFSCDLGSCSVKKNKIYSVKKFPLFECDTDFNNEELILNSHEFWEF